MSTKKSPFVSTQTYSLNEFCLLVESNFEIGSQTMRKILTRVFQTGKVAGFVSVQKKVFAYLYITPPAQDWILNELIPKIKKGFPVDAILNDL